MRALYLLAVFLHSWLFLNTVQSHSLRNNCVSAAVRTALHLDPYLQIVSNSWNGFIPAISTFLGICPRRPELNVQQVFNKERKSVGEVNMCCKSVCFITVMVVTINMIDVLFITSHSLNSLDGGKDE